MRIILEPKVVVIGKPTFIEHPEYKIPADGTDVEQLCSFAAKGCYDSYGATGRSNVENQRAVMESEHGSVLEHAHFSLFIEGITRALSLELNRHRPFNISQRSTRYTKEEESAIVLEPYYADIWTRSLAANPTNRPTDEELNMVTRFVEGCQNSVDEYRNQVETLIKLNPNHLSGFDLRKWARGKARNILPHALETRGTWTNNIRGLRWFVELRSERHAEPEIRLLANKIYEAVKPHAPVYFEDFSSELVDGILELKPKYHKV